MKNRTIALLLAGFLATGCMGIPAVPVLAEEETQDTVLLNEVEEEVVSASEDAASETTESTSESARTDSEAPETIPEESNLETTESTVLEALEAGEETAEIQRELTWNVTGDAKIEIRYQESEAHPNLRFAVWSAENGQDDLTWTEAASTDGRHFTAVFDPGKLKHLGLIHIHAYTLDPATGKLTFVERATAETGIPSVGSISIADLDEAGGTCTLVLSGLQHPELIKEVQVPTWSSSDQSDIVWYKAVRQNGAGEMTYTVPFSVAKHAYNCGSYLMHVYCTDTCGSMKFQTKTDQAFTVKQGSVDIQSTDNSFLYQAEAKDFVIPGGWSELRFAVWSAEGGQDDLKWITSKSMTASIQINDYKHLGFFHVHCYAVDKNGTMKFAGKGTFTPEIEAPVVELGEQSSEGSLEVRVKNLQQNSYREITAAVWSKTNGQDDLRWYSGTMQKDGTGKITVNMKNHKDAGQYYIHVYGVTNSGAMQFIGKNEELVIEAPSAKAITVADVNQNEGTFTVKIELPANSLPVSRMQVPVWCAADQSDIKWYDAVRQSDGSYQVTVKTSNHREHAGNYQIHVYGTFTNGLFTFLGKTAQEMKPTPVVALENAGSGKRTVLIRNCPNAKSVVVPVWSSDNGQDDLIWYPATRNSNGTWQAVIDTAKHRNAGEYLVHVYADNAFAGKTSFNLDYSEVKTDYTEIAEGMEVAASSQQLILVAASGTSAQITMLNKNSDGTWFQLLSSTGYVGINGVGPTTEWNRKTPPGVFGFTKAFGILPNPGTAFPYVQVDQSHYWVDDVNSKYYNQFVSSGTVVPDWNSAEHLIDYTGSYGYCLAIDYNPDCVPGVGSAIFLHCSAGRPTAGCVSVPESVMKQIMQLVRTDCKIVIDSKSGLSAY